MRSVPDFSIEKICSKKIIAGVDEAGRGPLCGPVVAGAVVFLKYDFDDMPLITDSKQMSEKQRDAAYDWITNNKDIVWATAQCSAAEIDELNILWASMTAMERAVDALKIQPEHCLVDGNRVPKNLNGAAVVKGDAKSLSIAAASILAKVTRDRLMHELSKQFPQYGWEKNAGYPTPEHLRAIEKYGINEHYRKTFGPVKKVIENVIAKN
ncbi:MAG: ribonuclease HII [Alphaproteobacteria bacterium]|nr:ribonuclease HII [Alphaproteobacteria bacterium]